MRSLSFVIKFTKFYPRNGGPYCALFEPFIRQFNSSDLISTMKRLICYTAKTRSQLLNCRTDDSNGTYHGAVPREMVNLVKDANRG